MGKWIFSPVIDMLIMVGFVLFVTWASVYFDPRWKKDQDTGGGL